MWNTNHSGSSGGGSTESFVREGNLDFLIIPYDKMRVTPLTEDVDIEELMSQEKMTREQATEYLYTVIGTQKWVNPMSYWEHQVPSIPNVRFFSTIPCQGRKGCRCCIENGVAETNGVTENRHKPFPLRKKFIIPVWVYSMERVLYIRQNEDFVNAMGQYINQNGSQVDFDIWREGKGFQTRYHSMYLGPRQKELPAFELIEPYKVDLKLSEQEINSRIGTSSDRSASSQAFQPSVSASTVVTNEHYEQSPNDNGQAGVYLLPFGTYKGKSLEAVYQIDPKFLEYLSTQGAGLVKEKVNDFLNSLEK